MKDIYLYFHTRNRADCPECDATAIAILRKFGEGLEFAGFSVDYEVGHEEPDYVFVAHRDETVFVLAMTLLDISPSRWVVGLEDHYYGTLQSPAVRREVHPILQAVIESWPGVSEISWYDHETLRERLKENEKEMARSRKWWQFWIPK